MSNTIYRLPKVKTICGLARSTVYQRVCEGLFTKPIRLGGRAVGWPANEIDAINAARIAGKTDDEVRTLVIDLESRRAALWKRFENV